MTTKSPTTPDTLVAAPLLVMLAVQCEPTSSADVPVAPAAAVDGSVTRDNGLRDIDAAAKPARAGQAVGATGELMSASLRRLEVDSTGELRAQLAGPQPVRVALHLATKSEPLTYRCWIAYYRIGEQLAPGLVPPTVLRLLSLAELAVAAQDEQARRYLRRQARVLADGRVRAAVMQLPRGRGRRVDVADLTQGGQAWSWESQLVSRQLAFGKGASVLASYQALVAVDYVLGNLRRRYVVEDEAKGRLLAIEGNDVFSDDAAEHAVSDGLTRFSRFMTYSAALARRVHALQRTTVERLLRLPGDDPVTPRQIDEIMSRTRTIDRLIQIRVRQRGKGKALALP